MGLCIPYGLDPNCEGALSTDEPIAVFADGKSARCAITISKKLAELEAAQGKPANTDFTESIKYIKVKLVDLIEAG